MESFNTSTVYANDYTRYRDILDADYYPPGQDSPAVRGLKVKLDRIQLSDYQRVSTGFHVTSETRNARVWNPTSQEFDPDPHGELRLDSGERWLIGQSVHVEQYGRWEAVVNLARGNA